MSLGNGRFQSTPHCFVMMRRFIHTDPKHLAQLRGRNNNCCCIGKADDDRMGQKVDQHTQPEQAEQQLEHADKQRENNGIGQIGFGTCCHNGFQC